jgi:hypothetical protein
MGTSVTSLHQSTQYFIGSQLDGDRGSQWEILFGKSFIPSQPYENAQNLSEKIMAELTRPVGLGVATTSKVTDVVR